MNASVTGVKTITVEFNKAIADASKVKATVKKGTADRGCKATVDGSKITLAMDAKLTKGEYTVNVEGVADAAMTATVNVEKDETLTSFYIGENLIQTATAVSGGYIYYAALNQYGEKMNANDPTANCTFGEIDTANCKSASAESNGKIAIKNIPSILAIQGTTGTVVLVDNSTGVSTTGTVTFSNPATAAEVEIVGLYNANKSKVQGITEQDNPGNYKILMKVKDQYGNELESKDLAGVTATIAGGLTNVEVASNTETDEKKTRSYFADMVVEGQSYVALSLKSAYAVAGSFTLTMVNSNKGLLLTQSFDVSKYVVIKSIKITADNGLYNNQENELSYEVLDSEGKSVTSYAVLKSTTAVLSASQFEFIQWEKQNDGTAKLIAKPKYAGFTNSKDSKETTIGTFTMSANTNTSSDYMVNTFTMTISEDRFTDGLIGIDSGVKTTVSAVPGAKISIGFDKIIYADQYGNKVTKAADGSIYPTVNLALNATTVGGATSGCSIYMASNAYFTGVTNTTDKKYEFTASGTPGSATVYLKYFNSNTENKIATESNYDQKVILTAVKTTGVDVSTLKIDSINSGYAYKVAVGESKGLSTSDIKVTAMMGGTEVEIPTSQYVVKGCENNKITAKEDTDGVNEKTAKVTIVVSTYDNNNLETATTLTGEYKISTKNQAISKICGTNDAYATTTVASGTAVTVSDFEKLFKYDDQYGIAGSKGASPIDYSAAKTSPFDANALKGITYTINVVNGYTKNITTSGEGTNSAKVVFHAPSTAEYGCKDGYYVVKVTATLNGESKTQTFKVTVY